MSLFRLQNLLVEYRTIHTVVARLEHRLVALWLYRD